MRSPVSLVLSRRSPGALRRHTPLMTLARVLRSAIAAVALMLLGACSRDVLTVQMGGVTLNVTGAASSAAIDSWRVTISGPGGAQTRTGSPGTSIQFTELQPGSYSVLLEGFEGADIASRGQTTVTVQAGSTATATVSLAAVLPTLTVSAADTAASEVGPDTGSVTISRSGPISSPLPVNLTIGGTATPATDYQIIAPTTTIAAGQRTVVVSVVPVPDAVQESAEAVVVALASGTGYAVGTPSSATVTIADSPLPSVTVTAFDADASEVGPNTGTYRIARTGATTAALAVGVTLSGSAVNGTDYQTIATPQTIPAGAAFVDVVLTPLADAVVETSETAVLTVVAGTGYAVGTPASATVNIADAILPVVTVTAFDPDASEVGSNTGTYRIARTGATTASLAVGVTLTGSALNGTDYQTIALTQTIPAGAAFADVVLTPLADALVEPDETAVLTVAAGSGYVVGTPASATVTIAQAPPAATNLLVTPALPSVRVGEQLTLVPTVTVAGPGVGVTYTFATSDATRATVVSSTGLVTGVALGTVTITVTATASGGGFTPAVLTAPVSVGVVNSLGVGFGAEQFANIPAGSGLRGSTNGNADEQPVRTIFVSAFAMQRTEVTQGQWRQVMAGTALANPSGFSTCGDTCPVELVSWDDVQQFITRLNQQDPGKGYRLPTEAEWEWAARAGTTGDLNVAGQSVEALAWISTNSQGRTWRVAQKLPNAFGLYDTIGNVWEWVNDWYSATYYSAAPPVDPPGPTTGTRRALRGSSWFFNSGFARVAIRENLITSDKTDALGLRLARNP